MREILFRGIKTGTKGEWTEGYLLSDREKQTFYICEGIGCSCIEVYEHTVSQFTGLLDKNGVKIFENDTCKDEDGYLFKVIRMNYGTYALKQIGYDYVDEYIDWEMIEVIGNIHE